MLAGKSAHFLVAVAAGPVVAPRRIVVAARRAARTAGTAVTLEQLLVALAHRSASACVGSGMLELGTLGDAASRGSGRQGQQQRTGDDEKCLVHSSPPCG